MRIDACQHSLPCPPCTGAACTPATPRTTLQPPEQRPQPGSRGLLHGRSQPGSPCPAPADEEAFFKEDADEEMHDLSPSVQSVRDTPSPVLRNGAARPPPRPLVDYGEDDDDGSPSHPDGFLAGVTSLGSLTRLSSRECTACWQNLGFDEGSSSS